MAPRCYTGGLLSVPIGDRGRLLVFVSTPSGDRAYMEGR